MSLLCQQIIFFVMPHDYKIYFILFYTYEGFFWCRIQILNLLGEFAMFTLLVSCEVCDSFRKF